MGYMMMRFNRRSDVEDYHNAGKKAKHGLKMVMDGLERGDHDMILAGAEKAWRGVRTMCDISGEMEEQYGERSAHNENEWNERDDQWMERRMRDSRGRYM